MTPDDLVLTPLGLRFQGQLYSCTIGRSGVSPSLYDLILLTDWNWPYAVKGRGSAIFIHQWRRPGFPTEGCVALRRADLHRIAPRGTAV